MSDSNTPDLFSAKPRRNLGGRPRKGADVNPKSHITLRVDTDVLEALKKTGPDWRARINDVLRATFATRQTQ
ncbi:BrnA antitoxin family protein [Komagataeibacter europaeus]|uniref:BrnA antitoxin family protein n=1 Tax=Komagataeibacter europaeus TaxID=33995 RepID=UPI0038CD484E